MTADRRTVRRERLTDLALIALGSLLFALSVVIFSAPNDIAPGGVTGLATMLNYLFRLPIGVMSVAINIPLLLIGWKRLGHRFLLRTLLGLLLSSAMTDLLALFMPAFRGEPMLVCLFGGALAGLGLGLILSRGATTAGSEIVGRLLEQRFPHVPIGRLILLVDAAVVLLSAAVYRQLESPLYATVFIFVSSLVTDRVVYGGRAGRMAMILTSRQPELTEQDFYFMEIGSAGIMRGFMAHPCDEALTLEKKLRTFLTMSLRSYHVPEDEIKKAVDFIGGMDIRTVSERVMHELFKALAMRFEFTL